VNGQRFALILAGGVGSRLCLLSDTRAKPAVPFAGKYRIIDFSLSNCVNSGIFDIGVLTQYRPTSLNRHIGTGRPWDLDRTRGGVQLLQPFLSSYESDWYKGTADAIYQNLIHLRRRRSEEVLVLSGDHVYAMAYNVLHAFHTTNNAAMTVAVTEVPLDQASSFGVLDVDERGRVVGFEEKPREPRSRLVSMGVYVFTRGSLVKWLQEDAAIPESGHDFGKDIVPRLVARGEAVYAYRFRGYWQDVGTLESYYHSNLAFLDDTPPINLHDPTWIIHTRSTDKPPIRMKSGSTAVRSLVCNGCEVAGRVERSLLSPGVVVEAGAVVRDSIVMNGVRVGRGAVLDRTIVDKDVRVGAGARVGFGDDLTPNRDCPEHLWSGITLIGREAWLPEGITIGRNCRIAAGARSENFPGDLSSGSVVEAAVALA
jgi:glucose-1-phosphate adenylyltransferase